MLQGVGGYGESLYIYKYIYDQSFLISMIAVYYMRVKYKLSDSKPVVSVKLHIQYKWTA